MSRGNQTDLAILGALSLRPMTGYALREAIVEVLGHFWRESFGQIYPALADLEAQGLVRRREGDRPNSSLFELTPEGSARLLALLREPATQQLPRNGLLLRLFFGSMLGHDECKRLVLEARAEAERAAAALDAHAGDRSLAAPSAPVPALLVRAAKDALGGRESGGRGFFGHGVFRLRSRGASRKVLQVVRRRALS